MDHTEISRETSIEVLKDLINRYNSLQKRKSFSGWELQSKIEKLSVELELPVYFDENDKLKIM